MNIIITNYNELDRNKWSEFVYNHPYGNIFHTPEFVDLYNSSKNYAPIVISCFDVKQNLIGLLVCVIQKEFRGFFSKLTARAIVWGGPLVLDGDRETVKQILDELDKICINKVIYSQFRNLEDQSAIKDLFINNGYVYEDHLDILINLRQSPEILWKNINSTRKKQINRSIKRGITTQIVDDIDENNLLRCFFILEEVYKKAKLPYPDISFFSNAIRIFQKNNNFKVILAFYNNEVVGFRFFLSYKSLLYDWYAGSLFEHHDKYPNDILPWTIIKWGSESGYKAFDFGGAGNPNKPYGVRDYKKKFGGNIVNYGRFQKIYNKFLFFPAKFGFDVWRLIRFK